MTRCSQAVRAQEPFPASAPSRRLEQGCVLARALLVLWFFFSKCLPVSLGRWLESFSLSSPFCFRAVVPGTPAHRPQQCPWSPRPPCSFRTPSVVGPAVCEKTQNAPASCLLPPLLGLAPRRGQNLGFHLSFLHTHVGPMSGLSLAPSIQSRTSLWVPLVCWAPQGRKTTSWVPCPPSVRILLILGPVLLAVYLLCIGAALTTKDTVWGRMATGLDLQKLPPCVGR